MPRPHPDTTNERSVLATLGIAGLLLLASDVLTVPVLVRVLLPLVVFVATEAGGARGAIAAAIGAASVVALFAERGDAATAVLIGALALGALTAGWLTREGFPIGTGVTALCLPVCVTGAAMYATNAAGFQSHVVNHLDGVVAAYRTGDVLPPQVSSMLPTVRDLWVRFFPLLFTIAIICTMFAVYLLAVVLLPVLGRPSLTVGRFRFWRVPDVLAWVLIVGLFCFFPRYTELRPVGANLVGLALFGYGVAGLAIIRFFLLAWGLATSLQCFVLGALFVGGALSQVPLVPAFSIALGFLDAWLDFRGLNGPPLSAGRESAIHQ